MAGHLQHRIDPPRLTSNPLKLIMPHVVYRTRTQTNPLPRKFREQRARDLDLITIREAVLAGQSIRNLARQHQVKTTELIEALTR